MADKMAKPRKWPTAAFSMTSHNDNQIETPNSAIIVPGGAPTKFEGSSDVLKEKTHTWLLEKTKGRTAQFDLIFKRSSNRIEYQRRVLDLRSKREQMSRMKASITAREKQRDILHAEAAVLLHDDQRQALGRRAHDIHVEAMVGRAALDRLVRDLVDQETHLEAYRIRCELEVERATQLAAFDGIDVEAPGFVFPERLAAAAAAAGLPPLSGVARPPLGRLACLVEEGFVSQAVAQEMLRRCPELLGETVEGQLAAVAQFLIVDVGVSRERFAAMLETHPALLLLSVEANLAPVTAWLRT
eukprot:CAMPEP_0172162008 /NCGR_PEP_ID=MMETSP1050-20130122/6431_1 /TAXON_ID=233186 /ORGANISM="Cryptomonas curvata, Strain CCAP979/52" /LENGTH=299 /DNA_ID=CAMNT_0012831947 /DNA_START=462 /DNA_END=1358 /DNA_ORIENTATION=-